MDFPFCLDLFSEVFFVVYWLEGSFKETSQEAGCKLISRYSAPWNIIIPAMVLI